MIINLKNEIWKEYTKDSWRDKEVYKVSNYGRVISYKKSKEGTLISGSIVGGYPTFTAKLENGKNDLNYFHRVVAELFVENQDEKRFVIHKDFDKANNKAENLDWATQQELTAHNKNNPSVIKAVEQRKHKRCYSKLTEAKVKIIKRKINDPNRRTRMRIIAKQFGISEMQLYRIKSGENWANVEP
ncbi:HNH endonuclease [Zhouia sp. PK063]|uniref:HNH endonuclease n=1 Tax=Zhouia sp. PK063 TaxID=3373602 RepID=UPI0037AF0443